MKKYVIKNVSGGHLGGMYFRKDVAGVVYCVGILGKYVKELTDATFWDEALHPGTLGTADSLVAVEIGSVQEVPEQYDLANRSKSEVILMPNVYAIRAYSKGERVIIGYSDNQSIRELVRHANQGVKLAAAKTN